jgi:hypothetical protein
LVIDDILDELATFMFTMKMQVAGSSVTVVTMISESRRPKSKFSSQ